MPKRLGQIDTKDINYYSGQDRDPNTGLPKGLKSHSSVKKDTGVMDESLLGKIRQTLTGASSEINESVSEDIVQHDKLVKAIRNSETDKLTKAKLLSTAVKVRGLKSEEKEKGLDGKKCWKGYRLAGTKKKGGKTVDNCVKEDRDKAFDNVVAALRKKHGRDAVITKDNPPKPPTEAQKKAYAAHKAKIAAQDTRDPLEKSSQGRYSLKYSNRGSD